MAKPGQRNALTSVWCLVSLAGRLREFFQSSDPESSLSGQWMQAQKEAGKQTSASLPSTAQGGCLPSCPNISFGGRCPIVTVWCGKRALGVALERLRVVLSFGSCFRELGAGERSGCKMRAVLPVVGDKEMACHVPPGLCCGVYRGKPHGGLGLSTSSSVEGREDAADSREG